MSVATDMWTYDNPQSSNKKRLDVVTFVPESEFNYKHSEWEEPAKVTSAKELHEQRHYYKEVMHDSRPVYGILAEPMRGGLFK
jgi:hypothetical protein